MIGFSNAGALAEGLYRVQLPGSEVPGLLVAGAPIRSLVPGTHRRCRVRCGGTRGWTGPKPTHRGIVGHHPFPGRYSPSENVGRSLRDGHRPLRRTCCIRAVPRMAASGQP